MRLSVVGVKIEENKYQANRKAKAEIFFVAVVAVGRPMSETAHRAGWSEVEMKTNSKPEHQTTFVNNIFFMLQVFLLLWILPFTPCAFDKIYT